MPRPILLFSGPWADLPLDALAAKAAGFGYAGFELCCWGDHLEVQRGLSDDGYSPARLDLLARHHAAVRQALTRFRGREIDTAGDGFFASFDGPARAIRRAQAIVTGIDELGLELRPHRTPANVSSTTASRRGSP